VVLVFDIFLYDFKRSSATRNNKVAWVPEVLSRELILVLESELPSVRVDKFLAPAPSGDIFTRRVDCVNFI
jgi:hypothetical protein